jgi:cytochrome c-type biogenesis protein CcmH/NrfF
MSRVACIVWVALACTACGSQEVRDPSVDSNAPIVNPLAPGVRNGVHSGATTDQQYVAPPGMKTGIPK